MTTMTVIPTNERLSASLDFGAGQRGRTDPILRAVDIALAALALIVLAPVLIVIAILVYCSDPGPIFFGHRRLGRGAVKFSCFKFRSMVVDAEARLRDLLAHDASARAEWALDHKLRNDPRITRIGKFLRLSSLDELPQLFNVLRGEMSLVGPRPIVDGEVHRYGRYFSNYCSVRPGITGLWQISGRNDVSYRRRVAFDVAFARTRSPSLYFRVLVMTIPSVLTSRGSY